MEELDIDGPALHQQRADEVDRDMVSIPAASSAWDRMGITRKRRPSIKSPLMASGWIERR